MAIDVLNETLLNFSQLAKTIPPMRGNRPVHVSTIHRWRSRGVRGVRLEATRIGGSWHTSSEAFKRFCVRLTAVEDATAVTCSASKRQHTHQADRLLENSGW